MVTVYDVAQASGLSIASVSRALNGRPGVSVETTARIRAIADRLGYQPNELARALVAKATQTIALLVPDITNPYFPELVKGVQAAADAQEHLLVLVDAPTERDLLAQRLAALQRKQVDGVILVAPDVDTLVDDLLGETPTVFLDRAAGGVHTTVGIDQERAGYDATMHLIAQGHSVIAHVSGPAGISVAAERRAGWERACREAGLASTDRLVECGGFAHEDGLRATVQLLERAPELTAVFAANDISALGAIAACTRTGRRVPDDISVIGIDGIELARFTAPALTTIAQPTRDLGHTAGLALLRELETGDRAGAIILPTRLQRGASVAQRNGRAA